MDVADQIILVRRPFTGKPISYAALDYAIRELLYFLLDVDPSDIWPRFFGTPEDSGRWKETVYGPKVKTDVNSQRDHGVTPSQVFPNTNKAYSWVCRYGHRWQASPNSRTSGRGCPYCSGNLVWVGFNDLATTHPEIAKEWHPSKNGDLSPTQISKGYNKKVWFLCPNCNNSYDSYIGNKIKGYGKCPYCSSRKTRARYVFQVETGCHFRTLKEAAKSIGTEDIRQIQMCCAEKCMTAHGYHWKYIEVSEEIQGCSAEREPVY